MRKEQGVGVVLGVGNGSGIGASYKCGWYIFLQDLLAGSRDCQPMHSKLNDCR